jgi:hypothetical protein
MRHRFPVAIALLAIAVCASPGAQSKATLAGSPYKTADGQPDLRGVWNVSTVTPLERPAEFATKPFLTDAEAREYVERMAQRNNRDTRSENREADVNGAYNEVWFDRGVLMARVNGRTPASLIVDPPDGKVPALTPAAQARARARAEAAQLHPADGPEDRTLNERCLLFNAGPPMLSGPYNNYVAIFQTKEHVVIANEMIHDARIIPLDGRPHLPASIRRWQGDPRGRWEGQTLVVETTNFTEKTNVRGSGPALRLVERFTRADAKTLLYEFTVDDPESFATPWTAIAPLAKSGDMIYEYACHEANYALTGILRGARAGEKR